MFFQTKTLTDLSKSKEKHEKVVSFHVLAAGHGLRHHVTDGAGGGRRVNGVALAAERVDGVIEGGLSVLDNLQL